MNTKPKINNYSDIISPELYNTIRGQHVYLNESDRWIIDLLNTHTNQIIPFGNEMEVVELGGGPFSLTRKILAGRYNLSMVEIDPIFFNYAHNKNRTCNPKAMIYMQDAAEYSHEVPVDVIVSQGFHHHVNPEYLKNARDLLVDDGIYILSDEFLPEYIGEHRRKIKAIGWYSFVIADAIRNGFTELAHEEVSTLIDELNSNKLEIVKDEHTLQSFFLASMAIGTADIAPYREELSLRILNRMLEYSQGKTHQNLLSRGDHKICKSVFEAQVKKYGFSIIGHQSIGLVDDIGGFRIFVLQKQ